MQTFHPDDRVVLVEGYGEYITLDCMLRARVTTISCIVGDPGLTEHMTSLFLASPYAAELAFLLPHHACDAEAMLRNSGIAQVTARLSVTLARSTGTRTVVVAVKRNDIRNNYIVHCPCRAVPNGLPSCSPPEATSDPAGAK